MAGSKAHVDDAIIERRLRPIYEWLDNGNNKKAVQEADKVLKKQSKLQCALVLKGLGLLRLGKEDECLGLINSVVSEGTVDDATLNALTICYRELAQPEQICKLYEHAVKLEPTNEELLSHLFMSHVRIGDYKKQQLTAMQLFKLKPKNPYYFWAIMSIVMQAQVTGDTVTKRVSLQLAERMVAKFVAEDKIDTEAEVLTYLFVLETQEKYADALKIIESPLVDKINQPQNFASLKRAFYHSQLKQYEESNQIYKTLILQESDNWQHYVNYVDTILAMNYDSFSTPNGKKSTLEEGAEFLRRVKENAECRSPFLGPLQLALKLREMGKMEDISCNCGDPFELLFDYISFYGDKTCCYSDIVNFLPLINDDEALAFTEKVKSLVKVDENDTPVDVKNIFRHQIWLQMMHALGQYDSFLPEEHVQLAENLVHWYETWVHLSVDMAATDRRPNDTYLILAAHSYLEAILGYMKNHDSVDSNDTATISRLVVKLCAILERGIVMSRANFQLKLLLIKVYNMIGATGASYFNVYEQLDLKHIQMDTLGYILVLQALDSGQFGIAISIFSATLKFFLASYKDTADSLILFYKFGSLIRIPEFVDFRERLNNSLHFVTASTEQLLLDLTSTVITQSDLREAIKQLHIDPSKDSTNWSSLRDNRDLHVMNTWKSKAKKSSPNVEKDTFRDNVAMLRIRLFMVRIIAAASELRAPAPNHVKDNVGVVNGEVTDCGDATLTDLVSQLEKDCIVLDNYKKCEYPTMTIEGPDIPRIYVYAKGNYVNSFLSHVELFRGIYRSLRKSEAWRVETVRSASASVDELFAFHARQVELLQMEALRALPNVNREVLASLVHLDQTMCLNSILLGCCQHILSPAKSTSTKKNRKKKGNAQLPEVPTLFNSYVSSFRSKLQHFETILMDKQEDALSHRLTNRENSYGSVASSTALSQCDIKFVTSSIEDSFIDSISTLIDHLRSKIKYLSSIKA